MKKLILLLLLFVITLPCFAQWVEPSYNDPNQARWKIEVHSANKSGLAGPDLWAPGITDSYHLYSLVPGTERMPNGTLREIAFQFQPYLFIESATTITGGGSLGYTPMLSVISTATRTIPFSIAGTKSIIVEYSGNNLAGITSATDAFVNDGGGLVTHYQFRGSVSSIAATTDGNAYVDTYMRPLPWRPVSPDLHMISEVKRHIGILSATNNLDTAAVLNPQIKPLTNVDADGFIHSATLIEWGTSGWIEFKTEGMTMADIRVDKISPSKTFIKIRKNPE